MNAFTCISTGYTCTQRTADVLENHLAFYLIVKSLHYLKYCHCYRDYALLVKIEASHLASSQQQPRFRHTISKAVLFMMKHFMPANISSPVFWSWISRSRAWCQAIQAWWKLDLDVHHLIRIIEFHRLRSSHQSGSCSGLLLSQDNEQDSLRLAMSGATALTPLVSPHCFREPNSPFSTSMTQCNHDRGVDWQYNLQPP